MRWAITTLEPNCGRMTLYGGLSLRGPRSTWLCNTVDRSLEKSSMKTLYRNICDPLRILLYPLASHEHETVTLAMYIGTTMFRCCLRFLKVTLAKGKCGVGFLMLSRKRMQLPITVTSEVAFLQVE